MNYVYKHIGKPVALFWTLFGLTILTIIGMQVTGAPLKTEAVPGGIVTFELIGTIEGSREIINSWQGVVMTYAGINMGLDFLFLTLYGITIALACMIVSDRLPVNMVMLKQIGVWLAVAVVFAAILDVIENIALIKLLLGSQNTMLPILAKWCAIPKFGLVLLALLYPVGGIIINSRKSHS